jgi:hypothetical protein
MRNNAANESGYLVSDSRTNATDVFCVFLLKSIFLRCCKYILRFVLVFFFWQVFNTTMGIWCLRAVAHFDVVFLDYLQILKDLTRNMMINV